MLWIDLYGIQRKFRLFDSNKGFFAHPQAIKDRERMSALSWWSLYSVSAPQLYSLAIKVLSQSVKSTCTGGALTTFEYIRNVKRNLMNAGHAESLVYVH